MDRLPTYVIVSIVGIIAQIISGVLPTLLKRLPKILSLVFRFLRITIPSAVLLGSIIWALWVGVRDSHSTGQDAANDLTDASSSSGEAATALTDRALERATYATAQSTQGLVIATVGVIAATALAAIGFAPERVSHTTTHSSDQSVRITAERVWLQAGQATKLGDSNPINGETQPADVDAGGSAATT